jgi:CBS domain-containing protein
MVSADEPIEDAASLLLDRAVSCLPVRGGAGEIVGVVTSHDLLRGMLTCLLPRSAQDDEGEREAA